jgi:hypothetical protein
VVALEVEFIGISKAGFLELWAGRPLLTAVAVSPKQTLGCNWGTVFVFDGGWCLSIAARMESLGGWKEIGSLVVRYCHSDALGAGCIEPFHLKHEVPKAEIIRAEGLSLLEDRGECQCGLVLIGHSFEIIIAPGISPGSISISAPFADADFEPEYQRECYVRTAL